MGILAILTSVYSIHLGSEYDQKVTLTLRGTGKKFKRRACVIMPCKGYEPGLERNIEAVLHQRYDDYETVIVTDSPDDPAHRIASSVLAKNPTVNAKLLISEPRGDVSGKVAALLSALEKTWGSADVYAFVDSDSLVSSKWLEDLVGPLIDDSVGSATGFRWYFPSKGGIWSYVEAAWNASGTNLFFHDRYNFPWGGSMAVRASTLQRICIRQVWANAVSDDMALNVALRSHGYRVVFLPQCTVATFNQTDLSRMLDWTTRQTILTKVFNRRLWNYALAAYAFFDFTFLLGIVSVTLGISVGSTWLLPAVLLLFPAGSGILRSCQRCKTFKRAMPQFKREFEKNSLPTSLASLLVPWVMTYCIAKSALTNKIEWRDRNYELKR